jgi:biopolymer transport protein ExbB
MTRFMRFSCGLPAVLAIALLAAPSPAVAAQPAPAGPPSVQVRPETEQPSSAGSGQSASAEEGAGESTTIIPTRDLWNIMVSGGPLMIPIGLCSVVLVAFVLERLVSLRRSRVIPKPFVTRFLQQLGDGEMDRERALALCEDNGSPAAEVFAGAVRKWGRPAVEVEQAVIDAGERVTNGLRRYLRVINGVATVAPLLGLLGTVLGMIRAFNDIAAAQPQGRLDVVATGISEALLTTAAGLSIAIPALICYLFFVSRVDRLIIEIDAMSQEVVGSVSAEGMGERKIRGPKARRVATAREPAVGGG